MLTRLIEFFGLSSNPAQQHDPVVIFPFPGERVKVTRVQVGENRDNNTLIVTISESTDVCAPNGNIVWYGDQRVQSKTEVTLNGSPVQTVSV